MTDTANTLRTALKLNDLRAAVALGFAGTAARILHRFFQMTLTNTTRNAWDLGGTGNIHLPATPVACEAISSSTSDAAAGTGARTITVEGLTTNYELVTETATMNGTSAVALTNLFIRVLDVRVATAGSGTLNAGNITIRTVSGSNAVGYIIANAGRMGSLCYTCPAGRQAFVLQLSHELANADVSYTDAATAVSQAAGQVNIYRKLLSGAYVGEGRITTRRVPVTRDFGYGLLLTAGQDLDVTLQTSGTSQIFTGEILIMELPA